MVTLIDCIVFFDDASLPGAVPPPSVPQKLIQQGAYPQAALENGSAANFILRSFRCQDQHHAELWQAFLNLCLDNTPLRLKYWFEKLMGQVFIVTGESRSPAFDNPLHSEPSAMSTSKDDLSLIDLSKISLKFLE